jgi:hypothetical protein
MGNDAKDFDCAVVIPSCDGYEDAWRPFFTSFYKYWLDCPFPVYLITEKKSAPDNRVKVLNLGVDHGWANNMKIALERIPEKFFIYFLEDVFLSKKVDTERILKLLEITNRDKISCLRLHPSPGPDVPHEEYSELGVIGQNAPYRVSTMSAIWDKNAFLRLLKPGENAWNMEFNGTKRSWEMNETFLSVWQESPAIEYFATAIKKGRWQYDAVKFCEKEGIDVDYSKRGIESKSEYIHRKIRSVPVLGWFYRLLGRLKRYSVEVGKSK